MEDANAIQVAVMIVMDGLYRGNLNYKKAALLLYGFQIASINLRHLHLAPAAPVETLLATSPHPAAEATNPKDSQ